MENGLARFSTWLLRPYLDLGPLQYGPLHCRAVEEGWRAFAHDATPYFVPQRALPRGFRLQLADEAGNPRYHVREPRGLPRRLRTERWQALCAALDQWQTLSPERRCRLAALLHSMCLYEPLLSLIAPDDKDRGAPFAELAFWRASAQYMFDLPARTADYRHADLAALEQLAQRADGSARTRFNAIAMIFAHKAKTGAPLTELHAWRERYRDALEAVIPTLDTFTAELFASRFFRGTAFLPQRAGQRDEVRRIMDLAQHHAYRMAPATPAQDHLFHENLHALMESRTKEALWLGDLEGALENARKVVQVDPYDAKAWVELGEVQFKREAWPEAAQSYAVAALLGPPASAVGRHMAGLCFCRMQEQSLAALFFKDALEYDPLGASPRTQILGLSQLPVQEALIAWSDSTLRL